MKNLILTFAMLFSVALVAQGAPKPKFEKDGDMVKATYYHENGKVAQTGFYLDSKPHGEWIAFNAEGKKIAIGEYNKGQKVGKWFFWDNEKLSEVDYSDSRVANVTTWNNANSIVVNQ